MLKWLRSTGAALELAQGGAIVLLCKLDRVGGITIAFALRVEQGVFRRTVEPANHFRAKS